MFCALSTYACGDVRAKVARSEVGVEVGEAVSIFMLTGVDYVQQGSDQQADRDDGSIYELLDKKRVNYSDKSRGVELLTVKSQLKRGNTTFCRVTRKAKQRINVNAKEMARKKVKRRENH